MEQTKPMKEKIDINKFWGIWNLAEAGVILAAGVLAIVMGVLYGTDSSNDFQQALTNITYNVLPYLVGGFIIMDAILRVILAVTKTRHDSDESILLIGGFELTAGILLMIFHGIFTDFIVHAIGVLLIVIGVLFVVFSVLAIAQKNKKLFIPVLEIVFAGILIAIGVAVEIIYGVSDGGTRLRLVLIIAGIIFTILAIAQLIITLITLKKAKKENKVFTDVRLMDDIKQKGTRYETKEEKMEDVIELKAEEPVESIEHNDPKAIERKDK